MVPRRELKTNYLFIPLASDEEAETNTRTQLFKGVENKRIIAYDLFAAII